VLNSEDEAAIRIEGVLMRQRRTVEESVQARTYRPLRQVIVFLCLTYAMALAIALALPHAGIAPLISIAVPAIAVAPTIALTVPRGQQRAIGPGSDSNKSGGFLARGDTAQTAAD